MSNVCIYVSVSIKKNTWQLRKHCYGEVDEFISIFCMYNIHLYRRWPVVQNQPFWHSIYQLHTKRLCIIYMHKPSRNHQIMKTGTWVWISSLIERLASCFFFTASSSTRGLMVMPCNKDERNKTSFIVNTSWNTKTDKGSYHPLCAGVTHKGCTWICFKAGICQSNVEHRHGL